MLATTSAGVQFSREYSFPIHNMQDTIGTLSGGTTPYSTSINLANYDTPGTQVQINDIENLKDEIQILKDEIENLKMLLLEN